MAKKNAKKPARNSIAARAQRGHRAGSRIAEVKSAFEKRGEIGAYRKGAALGLKCVSVGRWVQAWRKAGLEPVVTANPTGHIKMPRLNKKGLKELGKMIIKGRKRIAAMADDDSWNGRALQQLASLHVWLDVGPAQAPRPHPEDDYPVSKAAH